MHKIFRLISFVLLVSILGSSCIVSRKKYDEATKKAMDLMDENSKLKTKVSSQEDAMKKQSDLIAQLKGNIASQKGIIEALNGRIARLKDSIANGDEQIQSLEAKLGTMGDEKQKTSKELSSTKELVAAQKKSLEEIEAKRRKAENDIADQRRKLEEQIASQRAQLDKLQSFIDQQQKATEELRNKIAKALEGFTSSELTVTRKNGKVYISMQEGLLFPSGSAVVNKKGKEALAKVASVLNTNPDINIDVEGHTDSIAIHNKTYADNWSLSTARATSIAHVLIEEYNVSPEKLVASGRSQYDPVADNTTSEGRAANRRTEIILEPKLDEIMQMLNGK